MDAIMQWGITIVLALQALPGLEGVMEFFSFLGTEEFFLLIMPALYWCVDARLGARLAVVLIASNALNGLFKLAFHLPRPYWIDGRVEALSTETSYGVPSGHAQNATAVWGLLATQLRRSWAWAAAVALIFLISLSRVHLGVHFPSDVLGGWVIGGALLWAFVHGEGPLRARLGSVGTWPQVVLALVVSLAYAALAAGLLAALAPTPDPPAWEQTAALAAPPQASETAIDPRNSTGLASTAGMLFGLGAALALVPHGASFDARGPWWKRVARFVVGLVGILIFWQGLGLVLPRDPLLVALVFRYLRYALIVFWALYLAPWVFLRTRLAEPRAG
jgi:membrane-associated phospholipid phosphatase